MPSWADMFPVDKICSEKKLHAQERQLKLLSSAYDLQVSWLHFQVFDRNTTDDYVQTQIFSVMRLFFLLKHV